MEKNGKVWAVLCHIGGLLGFYVFPLGNIIVPLIIWIVFRNKDDLVNQHGKSAVNFQISLAIYEIVSLGLILLGIFSIPMLDSGKWDALTSIPLTFAILGIPSVLFVVFMFAAEIIFIIIACIKVSDERTYRYPFSIRFIK